MKDGVPCDLFWIVLGLGICVRDGAVQTAAVTLEVMHHLNLAKHKGNGISSASDYDTSEHRLEDTVVTYNVKLHHIHA